MKNWIVAIGMLGIGVLFLGPFGVLAWLGMLGAYYVLGFAVVGLNSMLSKRYPEDRDGQ